MCWGDFAGCCFAVFGLVFVVSVSGGLGKLVLVLAVLLVCLFVGLVE